VTPDNFSSRLDDALGKLVHETRAETAIDAGNASSFGQFAAESVGGFHVGRMLAGALLQFGGRASVPYRRRKVR
jgi:hypothetical protein